SSVTSFPSLVPPVPMRLDRRRADAAPKNFHCLAGGVSRLASARLNPNEYTNHENQHTNDDADKQPGPLYNQTVPLLFALPCGNAMGDSDPCSGSFSCDSRRIHCGLERKRPRRGGGPTAWRRRATPVQARLEWLRWIYSRRPIARVAE